MAFLSCRSLVLLTTNYSDSGDKRGGAAPAPPQTLPSFKDVAVTQISPGSLFFIVILFLFVVFNRIKSKMEPKHMQAQKIRGGAEEGGRQVLTEQLLPPEILPGLIARTQCPDSLPGVIAQLIQWLLLNPISSSPSLFCIVWCRNGIVDKNKSLSILKLNNGFIRSTELMKSRRHICGTQPKLLLRFWCAVGRLNFTWAD